MRKPDRRQFVMATIASSAGDAASDQSDQARLEAVCSCAGLSDATRRRTRVYGFGMIESFAWLSEQATDVSCARLILQPFYCVSAFKNADDLGIRSSCTTNLGRMK